MKNLFIAFILFLLVYLIYRLCSRDEFVIRDSKIQGKGLFTKRSYKRGEILIPNLFPYKDSERILRGANDAPDFNQVIMNEGLYINHCFKNINATLITKDYKTFPLIALKNIQKNEEIRVNYDDVNKRIPFIASSTIIQKPNYC